VLSADELQLITDCDAKCSVDVTYDNAHDKYITVIKALPREGSAK
jgi:hypothetical protein